MGLRQARTKAITPAAPLAGKKAEFVLQAHDIKGTIVYRFRSQTISVRLDVVDDVNDARIIVTKSRRFLNRREGGYLPLGRQIHRVSGVPGEGCQPALFRGVRGYEQRPNVVARENSIRGDGQGVE